MLTSYGDDPYGSYCYLCLTMEYPESKDWVIFNLRDDVTFSDGTPMTAEDVAYTFNLFQEQGIAEYRAVVSEYIETVEVLAVKYPQGAEKMMMRPVMALCCVFSSLLSTSDEMVG